MTEEKQIKAIIKGARASPTKVAAVVDNHKEERFLKKLRAKLPASDFKISSLDFTSCSKAIVIEKVKSTNPASN